MEFTAGDAGQQKAEFNKDGLVGETNIKVIGVGGAGNNMVSWLYKKGIKGAEILACNTDKQHLGVIDADKKFLIGTGVTRGLGCGGFPEKGAESAKESMQEIKSALKGTDMVFVCAGLGGGTGTGAAPVIAQTAKDISSIVIGTVTMPFKIERARIDKAEFALRQLSKICDTVIVIDNNRLVQIAGNLPLRQAFSVANELLATMLKGIVETIAVPSLVNLDFADVKAIMADGGVAAIGVGTSDTNSRVEEAVRGALGNPLIEVNYEGATGALIQIVGGEDMTLDDINKAGELVTASLDENANVIWGARVDPSMKGRITVMTIITGVSSPWIMGKTGKAAHYAPSQSPNQQVQPQKVQIDEELGIEVVS
ncbi:cell division protein FtsZ [Candidatus Woesearchaeota archaeon]|nr:cell division protein FtsZ [Candidatus Woesearchaeota archaeon]MBI2130345.1 cell division protein FtsZ [Candidatus Woesearchaeota archaeon]